MSTQRLSPSRYPHAVLDRLRQVTGWSDRQLALRIGMDVKGPWECRRSGATPYGHLVAAVRAGILEVDLHWLLTGKAFCAVLPLANTPMADASMAIMAARRCYEDLAA